MTRWACALALALLIPAGSAVASTDPSGTAKPGGAIEEPFSPTTGEPRLTEAEAVKTFLARPKVARWLDRYPPRPKTDATFDEATRRWTVHVWSGKAGEIAVGKVDDAAGSVMEAWTGPQVAWTMARGRVGAFGGKVLNAWWTWVPLSALFLVGLADRRRLRSWHTVDLLALLSFGVSLLFFNRGDIFTSAPLAVPPLLYLLGRTAWIGFRGRHRQPVASLPIWLLAACAIFLAGFRIGLDLTNPGGVIDVGYAGVIGADRILDGRSPYGNMPVEEGLRICGKADSDGRTRDRIQQNGRCESSNDHGDTYGPTAYLAYVPAVLKFGWSGKWDFLPAAHATAIAFDLLAFVGLLFVGLRFGGRALAATLGFAWMAFPFTAYSLNSNTNDAIMPAILIWGFWLVSSPTARGTAVALAGWTKFAALLLAPLWLTYPRGLERKSAVRFSAAFAVASAAVFSILLFEPSVITAAQTFLDRTIGFQLRREGPFSPWGWGPYHARGIPDLAHVQFGLQLAVIAFAGVVAAVPARKGPLELAALSAAVLIGFELVMTHWSYLYIPWFFPFVLLALFLPARNT